MVGVAEAGGTGRGARGGLPPWMIGVLCGGAIALLTPVSVLSAILLAPGLVARPLDRESEKLVSRCMLLLGAAAAIGPARRVLNADPTLAGAFALATRPETLAFAWAAAAAGWLIATLGPLLVFGALEAAALARAARLRIERERLAREWELESAD